MAAAETAGVVLEGQLEQRLRRDADHSAALVDATGARHQCDGDVVGERRLDDADHGSTR